VSEIIESLEKGHCDRLRNIASGYFKAFAQKDINSLQMMLAPEVTLRDWEIYAKGIDAVMTANLAIFNAVETIIVLPTGIYISGNIIVAELIVEINHGEPLKIVDILEVTQSGKICAIRAYKG
jgi:hypothetical protein